MVGGYSLSTPIELLQHDPTHPPPLSQEWNYSSPECIEIDELEVVFKGTNTVFFSTVFIEHHMFGWPCSQVPHLSSSCAHLLLSSNALATKTVDTLLYFFGPPQPTPRMLHPD